MAEVNSNKWYEDKSQVGMPKSTAAMERKSREDVDFRECAVRDDGREWVKNVFGVVCTATVGQLQELFSFATSQFTNGPAYEKLWGYDNRLLPLRQLASCGSEDVVKAQEPKRQIIRWDESLRQ
ncbi:hypothetical protein PHLCEN_2v13217 [Hermanssonia centrifuga]|uniref:Uncharacterized protein n=1 Tax=Hermanssonia centrifuga TaxID=98765 RepID=A0A2R6NEW4_9APHY|nr:hypothetical protein PHLCEN_2v13217 [Hermanssonia centrifuga]